MRPKLVLLALSLAVAAACTDGSGVGAGTATPGPSIQVGPPGEAGPTGPEPLLLDVVATTSGQRAQEDAGYLEGMRLAVRQRNEDGGVAGRPIGLAVHDDGGAEETQTALVSDLLGQGATAILSVGPGAALSPLRPSFAATGTPAILLSGDLYTSRGLFPQVFQTTIPWAWQANVIARYVITDRAARDVVFVGTGPEATQARRSFRAAMAYWGGHLAAGYTDASKDEATGFARAFDRAARSDWTVVFGSPRDALELVNALEEVAPGRLGVSGPAGLLVSEGDLARPNSGTTACSPYTWAGWADPIPRVGAFRRDLLALTGHLPSALEQEGYDAVSALADGLARTGGRGGPKLRAALEGIRNHTFSGFPVELGPDDHVFPPRDELGLFAVAGRNEKVDPWQDPGSRPWRAIMRTFTYGGRRTSVLDRDRRVFFPWWNRDLPGPNYFRSRYGIASRPGDDPLH